MQLVIGSRLVVNVKVKGEIMDVCDSGVLLYMCMCTEIFVLAYNKILNMQVFAKTMSTYRMLDTLMSPLDNGGKHVKVGCLCNAEYYWIFCWKLLNI